MLHVYNTWGDDVRVPCPQNHEAGFLIWLPWQQATNQLGNFATSFKFENKNISKIGLQGFIAICISNIYASFHGHTIFHF